MKLQKVLFIFLIPLIIYRYFSSLPKYNDGDLLKIKTTIYSEPIQYDNYQYLKINNLKVYLSKYPEVVYGDRLEIIGRVNQDKLIVNTYEILEKERGLFSNFRNRILKFYKENLPEPYSSLVSGIVLGSKSMPDDFWEKLKTTGTAHVVVASGTNISLLVSFLLSSLTIFIKRRFAVFITTAGILFYVFLSGFDAPIVRASIMAGFLFLAQIKGRVVESFKLLILTLMVMLVFKPYWLNDLGFILSFTATASIMLFSSKIEILFKKLPRIIKENVVVTLSAQIGVLPILYSTFGQFNLWSIIVNPLVLWVTPYIMAFGSLAGVLSLFVPLVARLILSVIFPFLYYFNFVVDSFSLLSI